MSSEQERKPLLGYAFGFAVYARNSSETSGGLWLVRLHGLVRWHHDDNLHVLSKSIWCGSAGSFEYAETRFAGQTKCKRLGYVTVAALSWVTLKVLFMCRSHTETPRVCLVS